MARADIVIAGAGVVGLSLALELRERGRTVQVLDSGTPGQASSAAAGMLAAHDPANPPALQPLAELSLALYPGFLQRIYQLTRLRIPFETEYVLEADSTGRPAHSLLSTLPDAGSFVLRPEQSLDPRKLLPALRHAAIAAGAVLRHGRMLAVSSAEPASITLSTCAGSLQAGTYVDCTGAWAGPHLQPAKGQMLHISLPPDTLQHPEFGNLVLRTPEIYIVPRLDGTALIGATVEDAGFSTNTTDAGLGQLRQTAAQWIPALAQARELERWAGLRPRTPDLLPLLGQLAPRHYVASGHFRNGILLAPATARVITQLLYGEPASVDLRAFGPHRFAEALPERVTSRTDLPIIVPM